MAAAVPILVTGAPRSGTTWLARLLAHAPGTALAGREPMNPRGHQYALGGTLDGWTRLRTLSRRQKLDLGLAYRGLNPFVYSRYGARQWAAPLPRTRIVIKDPFAVLSLPVIADQTSACCVLLYRHPAALLASYRRMGWRADTEGLRTVVASAARDGGPCVDHLPEAGEVGEAEELGHFWRALHQLALADLDARPDLDVTVVSHARLAAGGADAGRSLVAQLRLAWDPAMEHELQKEVSGAVRADQLHNFDRAPAHVAEAWRTRVSAADVGAIEKIAGDTLARLERRAGG
ncbi:MAG: sulfotransferase [Nocardioides sp.]